jgi:hypothetical protein
MLMAERDRLRPGHAGIRDERRTLDLQRYPEGERNNKYGAKYRGTRDCVGTAMKDLGHL